MIPNICTQNGSVIPNCVTITAIAYMLFEAWLGRTNKVQANSAADLILNGIKWLYHKIKGDQK